MLAYLDALCAALLARNAIEVRRLLALPDSRRLPRAVREEALAMARRDPDSFAAPVQALQHYYRLSHLVDHDAELGDPGAEAPARGTARESAQMEFRFRVRKVG